MDTKKIINLEKKFLMPTYSRSEIAIESGTGCYVLDKDGNRYIDLVGGLATCLLGHGNKKFAKAVQKQASKITNPTNLYYTEEQVKLAERLARLSGLSKCFFSNSGTEGVEAAIKLTRKHAKKIEIIAAKNGFHGRTFGSLAATGKDKIKKPFEPMLAGFKHIDYGDASFFEKSITKNTAAIIVEPIQGEAGIIVPPEEYLKHLREICNKNNVLLIIDEIQTGCGRTGKFFAFEHEKIRPDIVVLAKGLANGIPIGATIARDEIAQSFEKGDHGSTFGGNPVACAAANFTLDYITKNKLIQNAEITGKYFFESIRGIKSKAIKEIRGRGLMIGVELNKKGNEIVKKCLNQGLLVNCANENVLRFLPPLIINKEIVRKSMIILSEVLENEN